MPVKLFRFFRPIWLTVGLPISHRHDLIVIASAGRQLLLSLIVGGEMSLDERLWKWGLTVPIGAYFATILFLQGSNWDNRLSRSPATQVSFFISETKPGKSKIEATHLSDEDLLASVASASKDADVLTAFANETRSDILAESDKPADQTEDRDRQQFVRLGDDIVMLRSDFRLEEAASQREAVAVRLPIFINGEKLGELDLEIDQSAEIFADSAQVQRLFPQAGPAPGRVISLTDLRDRGVDLRYDPVGERIVIAR